MVILQNMGGIAPKVTPELLPDNLAQSASNVLLHKGGVAPLITWTTLVGLMPWWVLGLLCLLYVIVVYHNFTELAK